MATCPHCGGSGQSNGIAPLREFNGTELTFCEGLIMSWLVENRGRVVSRDSMMAAVYGHRRNPPMDRTLDVHMVRLRRKVAGAATIYSYRGGGWWLDMPECAVAGRVG